MATTSRSHRRSSGERTCWRTQTAKDGPSLHVDGASSKAVDARRGDETARSFRANAEWQKDDHQLGIESGATRSPRWGPSPAGSARSEPVGEILGPFGFAERPLR